jgi:hypothetical protein
MTQPSFNDRVRLIRASMRRWSKRWRVMRGKSARIALHNACAERREYERLLGQQREVDRQTHRYEHDDQDADDRR